MPEIGEVRKGQDLGRPRGKKYMWCSCVDCGKERWVQLEHGSPANKRCNRCKNKIPFYTRRGDSNPCWKGGRTSCKDGYILITLQPDDFFYSMSPKSQKGHVFEHRLVMAKHIRRCLHSWEIVHHKNHVRDDNRIENLQLVSDDRHKQISILERRIKALEVKVEEQGKLIKLLQWQNRQELKAEKG
jgi:hypothetical protein